MSKLAEKNLLVQLHISQWRAQKMDKRVTKEIIEQNEADQTAGRFQKSLIASGLLEEYKTLGNDARNYHYKQTLPWSDAGARLLPATLYSEYMKTMRGYRQEADRLAEAFIQEYPEARENARKRLGKMFNENDYPEPDRLASKFKFDVVVLPVPTALDPRIELSSEDEESIRKDAEKRLMKAQQEAMDDLRSRFLDIVNRLFERLNNPENRFKESTIENARELVDLIPKMNITNDPHLNKMAKELGARLPDSGQVLRDNPEERQKVADEAKGIIGKMERTYGKATTAKAA